MKGLKRSLTVVGILLMPFVLLYCSQAVMMQSLLTPFGWLAHHPSAAALTWLLVSLPSLALYGVTRRLFVGYIPMSVVTLLLTLISYYKNAINGAPLQLSDFSLTGELIHIAGYAMPQIEVSAVTVCAVAIAAVTVAALSFPDRKRRIHRKAAAAAALACAALTAVIAMPTGAVQSAAVDMSRDCVDQRDRNEILGVSAGMYASYALRYSNTAKYDTDVEKILSDIACDKLAVGELVADTAPDIIFVMSESFFDVARLPGVEFSEDPLPNFHALQDTCTHGRFISNTYGGGTGYVEMEVFSGITSALLREGDTLSSLSGKHVYDSMPSMVKLLKKAGYSTAAVHSHTNQLYERDIIYPQIGFDEVIFSDSFPDDVERRGPYISDKAFAEYIISLYEKRDTEKPCFIYGMSMENHQPYNADKFGFGSGTDITAGALDGDGITALDALLVGLKDADASLGMLTDYFSQADRPVVLVFAGDHLPSLTLPGSDSVYSRLGMCAGADTSKWVEDELKNMLSTDYVIWTNYTSEAPEEVAQSCTLMGLEVLKRAGVSPDTYFRWLDTSVKPNMLMYRARLFVDGDGNSYADVPEPAQQLIETYRAVVHGVLYSD